MNLAHGRASDRHYIADASRDGRLFLVRTIGPLSGGTRVQLREANDDWSELAVEAETKVELPGRHQTEYLPGDKVRRIWVPGPLVTKLARINCTNLDIVIRRKAS